MTENWMEPRSFGHDSTEKKNGTKGGGINEY